jgi:urease accessory protein
MTSWIVLQLADSAFPSGGFAHSAGIEAAIAAGTLSGVEPYCAELVDQLAHGSLPLVAAVHADPSRAPEIDALTDAMLWNHVAARASRAQGRALLDVAERSFGVAPAPIQHLAPVFGLVCRALDVDRDDALAAFLHLGVRGALSAAVRLGVCGPAEAQAIHLRLHPALDRALQIGRSLPLEDVAQTAPVTELVQGTADRLYSRLFQS